MNLLLSHITIDFAVCHGKPSVRGLRYPVELLLGLLSSGMTPDEILADYADLERDDILAALRVRRSIDPDSAIAGGRPMKFLVDAQLPRRAAAWLISAGCDAVHTLDLPDGNRTTDRQVIELADREQRVVVTKDEDFVDSPIPLCSARETT